MIPDKKFHKEIFLEGILKEIDQKKELIHDREVVSIYFGGGTPSLYPEAAGKILETLSSFSIAKDCEISFETNPEDLKNDLLSSIKSYGINRLSIGVQSFQKSLLDAIKRPEPASDLIEKAYRFIPNLSIDLLYDLPGQTEKLLSQDLITLSKLPISHLSLYDLIIEPHTEFHKKPPKKVSEKEGLLLLNQTVKELKKQGFQRYEITAFAKNGRRSRHNLRYWTGKDYLGFGPSSHSYYEKKRSANLPNILRYHKVLMKGQNPTSFQEILSEKHRQKEQMAVSLRILSGVNIAQFTEEFGSLSKELSYSIEKLIQQKLLVQEGPFLKLTEKGLLHYDTVGIEIM